MGDAAIKRLNDAFALAIPEMDAQGEDPLRRSITEADGSDPRAAITGRQLGIVLDLARGVDPKEAATRARVHPERVRRWLEVPRFQRAILAERSRPMTLAERLRMNAEVKP